MKEEINAQNTLDEGKSKKEISKDEDVLSENNDQLFSIKTDSSNSF